VATRRRLKKKVGQNRGKSATKGNNGGPKPKGESIPRAKPIKEKSREDNSTVKKKRDVQAIKRR